MIDWPHAMQPMAHGHCSSCLVRDFRLSRQYTRSATTGPTEFVLNLKTPIFVVVMGWRNRHLLFTRSGDVCMNGCVTFDYRAMYLCIIIIFIIIGLARFMRCFICFVL